jgi:phenylalanyl-tRNA synthetase beta chain
VHDAAKPLEFFDLKGDLEELLEDFDLQQLRFETHKAEYFEAALAGRFIAGDKPLAVLGELRQEIARHYKMRQPVWLAEVDVDRLFDRPFHSPRFVAYSRFPAVKWDFSLIVPDAMSYGELKDAIFEQSRAMIEEVQPVDIYRGGSVPAGHYSLLLRITFHSLTHTLTSAEADGASRQILESLASRGVRLRS